MGCLGVSVGWVFVEFWFLVGFCWIVSGLLGGWLAGEGEWIGV